MSMIWQERNANHTTSFGDRLMGQCHIRIKQVQGRFNAGYITADHCRFDSPTILGTWDTLEEAKVRSVETLRAQPWCPPSASNLLHGDPMPSVTDSKGNTHTIGNRNERNEVDGNMSTLQATCTCGWAGNKVADYNDDQTRRVKEAPHEAARHPDGRWCRKRERANVRGRLCLGNRGGRNREAVPIRCFRFPLRPGTHPRNLDCPKSPWRHHDRPRNRRHRVVAIQAPF